MPADQWFYRLDGKPHGPFTSAQFEKLIRGRTVMPDTEVSNDGLTWQTLRQAMAGGPANAPVDPADWMNAPTLLLGGEKSPSEGTDEKKPNPPA